MQSSVLCPVYRKWLQLHPEQARIKRQTLKAEALASRRKGDIRQATNLYRLVWEIAQSILFSLRRPDNHSAEHYQDLVIFAAAAMAHQQCCEQQPEPESAAHHSVLADTQQQLSALLPLYASEPKLLDTISQLKEWLRCNSVLQQSVLMH
ncbi:hypothetical protein [Alteromonas gilva]|uniref:Uncharacterized protein n=1 Tax=Alteromonas gilva TaxID=2987522 RepID=A0ABT5KWR9_9ALTE|nr:hypothetical protein [Alteromonas gilva]MDC8829205.1 hypothetical protein [Alteromonas gilva]